MHEAVCELPEVFRCENTRGMSNGPQENPVVDTLMTEYCSVLTMNCEVAHHR